MLNISSQNFKTEEELRSLTPSVFQETPIDGLSDKYRHLTTWEVVKDMKELGWDVIDAKEVKARKSVGYQKHLLVFRNPELSIERDGDIVYPQILLTNSHDGKSSFRFTVGLFRMICENGLVVADESYEDIKIKHMGYRFEVLKEEIKILVEALPNTITIMNKMIEREINEDEQDEFIDKAIDIRFGKENSHTIDFADLVEPLRDEDKGNTLWNIFNTIQERMIKGNFEYQVEGKTKSRKS